MSDQQIPIEYFYNHPNTNIPQKGFASVITVDDDAEGDGYRRKIVIKKSAGFAASVILLATMVIAASASPIVAGSEVDCRAVMNELYSGKHRKEVAKDLSISIWSVDRCRRHAQAAAKASTKTSLQARQGRDTIVARPGAASPAGASSPATTK